MKKGTVVAVMILLFALIPFYVVATASGNDSFALFVGRYWFILYPIIWGIAGFMAYAVKSSKWGKKKL